MKCQAPKCRNKVAGLHLCNTCRSKKWREENPVKYAFYNLRNRAKQRGVLFTITFEDFKKWCHRVDWIGMEKGRGSNARSIDRRHNDIGYHLDNIQVLTKRDNVIKYFSYDYRSKQVAIYEGAAIQIEEPTPF
jgi:nitrate reductase beta subunit